MIGKLMTAGGAAAVVVALRRASDRGATAEQRTAQPPGDELVPEPAGSTTVAVGVDAPAAEVWRRLVQDGRGRGGACDVDLPGDLVGPDGASSWREARGPLLRCAATTVRLLARGRLRLPVDHVGLRLLFGDGSTARVYRETVVVRGPAAAPCVLVVGFRLRGVRGRRGHAAFRRESILNTPLFAGFPGLLTKLWLAHDENGTYRGLYEWDGADAARAYVQSLSRVLGLVCVPGSVRSEVLPGVTRSGVLPPPGRPGLPGHGEWWRPVAALAQ